MLLECLNYRKFVYIGKEIVAVTCADGKVVPGNTDRTFVDIVNLAADFSLKGIFVKKMLEKISSCSSDEEKEQYENALYIGLKAFDGEVSFYEN